MANLMIDWQGIGVGFTILSAILGTAWYSGNRMGRLETSVDEIKNNHLHTIDGRLSTIETVLMGAGLHGKNKTGN